MRIALLGLLIGITTGVSAQGHRIHLDFDHDHDLWTINSVSHMDRDTISIILEVGSDPIDYNKEMSLFPRFDCCCVEGGCVPGVDFWWWMDWCNLEIFESCDWYPQDCSNTCECLNFFVGGVLLPDTVFEVNQRHLLLSIVVDEFDSQSCESSGQDTDGYFQFMSTFHSAFGETPYSNIAWIGEDIPADIPEPRDGIGEGSWGRIKSLYR